MTALTLLGAAMIVAGALWGALALWFQSPGRGRARVLAPLAWLAVAAAALAGLAWGHRLPAVVFERCC